MKIDIPVSQPYRVDIAPGLLDDLGRYVSSGTAALVVTEEHVAPLLLERACRALRDAGVRAVPAILPAGEETKSLAQYAALLHKLAEAGLTRADTVVALGGSVSSSCGSHTTAALFDPDLFSHLAAHGTDFDRMTVLPRCIACKRDAVCADEFDRGARQLLNLGHTAGHAIETLSGYRIAHGHAVAIGLAIMARVFCRDAAEIEAALIKLGLPTRTEFSPERLAQAALADKKRAGERITLVIPRAIGDCVLREVPVDTLADIFERGM